MFLDHTQRRSTVRRTPLDEWSARRRDLYLTTHDTHNRQISMPSVGFELTNSAGERPQAAHLLSSLIFPWYFPDISLIFPWYFPDISLSFLSLLSLVLSNPSFLFSWFIIHHLWSASLRAVSLPAVKNCTNSCPIMTPHWRHSRRQWPVCRNCLATKDTFKPSL